MDIIAVAHAGVISDAPTISNIGMNVLNFLLSAVGIIAIISILVSGTMYILSFGDEKKMRVAKNSAQYAFIGVVVAMGGMIAIRFVGQFFVK